jgi:NAD(P)-dependent dehydrogenase (short-subunit alcohol dehydrogenase family)
VFITGSSDGLSRMAAQLLIEQGHRVVLHARNERRGEEALAAMPGAETVVIGDPRLMLVSRTRAAPRGSEESNWPYYGRPVQV